MQNMKVWDMIALILLIIGGLNWGVLGLTGGNTNVVWVLLGAWPWLVNVIYVLVGLSAVYVGWMAMMKKQGM
jgi:uncharacterized protein